MLEWLFWALYVSIFVTGGLNVHVGGASIFLSTVLFALFVPLALLRAIVRRTIVLPTWLWLVMLALTATLIATLLANFELAAITQLVQVGIFLIAAVSAALLVPDRRDVPIWFGATTLGCAINAAVGVVQSIEWIVTNGFVFFARGQFFRISGLLASPADYVTMLMIGLALAVAHPKRSRRHALTALYGVLLLLSMSRTGIIVFALASAIAIGRYLRGPAGAPQKSLVLLAAGGLVVALSSVSLLVQRVADIGNTRFNSARVLTFQDVITQSTRTPSGFFFGNGLGTYEFYNPSAQAVFTNTHNIYLFFLYSTGVSGLLLFGALIVGLIRTTWKARRRGWRTALEPRLLDAIIMLHVFVWIEALVETNLLGVGTGWLIGFVLGIPVALRPVRATS